MSEDDEEEEAASMLDSDIEYQQLLNQSFPHGDAFYGLQGQHAMYNYQQGRGALPSQSSTPQQHMYNLNSQQMMPPSFSHTTSFSSSSQSGSPFQSPPAPTQYQHYGQLPLKREQSSGYMQPTTPQQQPHRNATGAGQYATASGPEYYGTVSSPQSHAYHQQMRPQQFSSQSPTLYSHPAPQQHHHHRLPSSSRQQRYGAQLSSTAQDHGPPSVVGQPGMPNPAPRPQGPKLKFTPEEDALLIELKETKNLTWKQIADFFPGRSSGTLQVRYCTKLKPKTAAWTDDMVRQDAASDNNFED